MLFSSLQRRFLRKTISLYFCCGLAHLLRKNCEPVLKLKLCDGFINFRRGVSFRFKFFCIIPKHSSYSFTSSNRLLGILSVISQYFETSSFWPFFLLSFYEKLIPSFFLYSGRMLPLRPPAGKPAPLVCTYAATGHNSAVLSLDVTEDLMFTGSKGWFLLCMSAVRYGICMCTCYSFLDWVVLVKQ